MQRTTLPPHNVVYDESNVKGATMVDAKRTMMWALVAGSLLVCAQTADAQFFPRRRFGFGGFGGVGPAAFGTPQTFYYSPTYTYGTYYSGQTILPGWSATGTGYAAPRMRATLDPAVNIDDLAEDTNIRPAAYAPAASAGTPRRYYAPQPAPAATARTPRRYYAPQPTPYIVVPRCVYP